LRQVLWLCWWGGAAILPRLLWRLRSAGDRPVALPRRLRRVLRPAQHRRDLLRWVPVFPPRGVLWPLLRRVPGHLPPRPLPLLRRLLLRGHPRDQQLFCWRLLSLSEPRVLVSAQSARLTTA